ncbi:MAG: glyoxalase [Crocinitomicaceae bacterium]|nr:glyoxalase [Crocinitomicaceae bacterium]
MTQSKLSIRPKIDSITPLNDGSIEAFQNGTLRQVIKLQHDVLMIFLKSSITKNKGYFNDLKDVKKKEFITNEIRKNIPLRNQIIGIIIGLFTSDEMNSYLKWKNDIDRRITNICIERYHNSLSELTH